MTPVQIAYFKHFLFDRGIQAIYISMYRKSRIKRGINGETDGNPESLEQFLQEQPPFRVLMHAFYFQAGSDFGYDYWKDINKKWLKYLEMQEDNPQNDKVVVLKGSFAILRQNWDNYQYWKTEDMETTYARMHMEPPLKDVDLEQTFNVPRSKYPGDRWVTSDSKPKFKIGDVIKGSISGEVVKIMGIEDACYCVSDGGLIDFDKEQYWELSNEEPYIETNPEYIVWNDSKIIKKEEEETDTVDFSEMSEVKEIKPEPGSLLEGFSLVETTNKHGGKKMGNNIVSVNLRNNGYRVTFASKQSDKLRKHGYKYVKLLTKKETGEIALIFNNQSGCTVSVKRNSSSESRNVTINAKDIASNIAKFYSIKAPIDYFTLEITATIQQDLNTIYKLKLSE